MHERIGRQTRRPRKRPPLRSYVPFTVLLLICVMVLGGALWLLVTALHGGSAHPRPATGTSTPAVLAQQPATATNVPAAAPSSTAVPASPSVASATQAPPAATAPPMTPVASATDTPVPTATTVPPTDTPIGSSLLGGPYNPAEVPLTPGGPLPTHTPIPTSTPTGGASLVVARDVDASGHPLEAARRFLSPAPRLWAVAVLPHVRTSDLLRFVFQRNGRTLPHDDIEYTAGTNATKQAFSAYADYAGGGQPLPHGNYRVLFYLNGTLAAETTFVVG